MVKSCAAGYGFAACCEARLSLAVTAMKKVPRGGAARIPWKAARRGTATPHSRRQSRS